MGGTVKKVFGGGSSPKPDTSAYEAQLEEQRKATEAAEAKAAAADARARDQRQRLQQGRAATISPVVRATQTSRRRNPLWVLGCSHGIAR